MITVLISCKLCGLVDAPVPVRARGPTEGVREWMALAQRKAAIRHVILAPLCTAPFVDVVIPIAVVEGALRVGVEDPEGGPRP